MSVSIIISYHQESQAFLEECISQVRSTIHFPVEIIVVDDCSRVPLNPIDGVRIIRKSTQLGVGNSFDVGIDSATHENIIFMACDIRLADNGWADKLINEIELHPQSLVCTTCIGMNKLSRCCEFELHSGMCLKCRKPAEDNMDFAYRRTKSFNRGGATILIFHDKLSEKHKPPCFRNILEPKWLPYKGGESYEVPCILGACYAVKKSWYKYIDGFWGHKTWGSLESYISLKSILFGGSCRVVPEAETGHIFKHQKDSPHQIPSDVLIYNKILIATLLFDDADRLINFLGYGPYVIKARNAIRPNLVEIEKKRQEYKSKTTFTIEEYVKKFGIDYRK